MNASQLIYLDLLSVIVPPAMEVELFIHTSAIMPEHLAVNITYAIHPECVSLLPSPFISLFLYAY